MAPKTAAQKILMKEGAKGYLVHAPVDVENLLGGLPVGFTVLDQPGEPADYVLLFADSKRVVEDELGSLKKLIKPAGLCWVAYHKGTSGVKTDLNRDILREYAATIGLEAVALVAINEDWSAMRLKMV